MVYNESNISIIVASVKDPAIISEMIHDLTPLFQDNMIHLSTKRIRGGTAIALSSEAVNENQFISILHNKNIIEESIEFSQKLNNILTNKTSFSPSFRKVLPTRLSSIKEMIDDNPSIFSRFGKAIDVLSRSLSVNIKELLNKQGIKWDTSKDNTSITLYIVNAQTNAPQPIARISADTLQNPNDFQKQLLSIIDFAKGQAPGTEEAKKQELQAQEQTVRDVAQAIVPPEQNQIAQQINQPQQGAISGPTR
jgi:hypothetical protein